MMLIAEMFGVISEDGNRMLAGELFQDVQAADSSPAVGGNHASGLHPKNSHDYCLECYLERLKEFLVLRSQVELGRRRESGNRGSGRRESAHGRIHLHLD